MASLYLPNGDVAQLKLVPLYRRRPRSRRPYLRVTDWLASAGELVAWGRTRREAIEALKKLIEGAKVSVTVNE